MSKKQNLINSLKAGDMIGFTYQGIRYKEYVEIRNYARRVNVKCVAIRVDMVNNWRPLEDLQNIKLLENE